MKRDEKKQANRQKIIDAAYQLVTSKGIKDTSVRDVADESGISYVTMYKYFADKNDLIDEVMIRIFDQYSQQLMAIAQNSNLQFGDKLRKFSNNAQQLRGSLDDEVVDYFFKLIDIPGKVGQHASEFSNKLWTIMIADGKKKGDIKTEVSDRIVIMYTEMFMRYINNPDNKMPENDLCDFEKLFMNSLIHQ